MSVNVQDDNIDGYSFGSALPNLEITWTAKGSVESQSLGKTQKSSRKDLSIYLQLVSKPDTPKNLT